MGGGGRMEPLIKNPKYWDNDKQHGILYDWALVKKEFDKLGIPDNVYNPFKTHKIESGKWIVDMSERNTGKSTNWLLIMLCLYKVYGSETAYIREIVDMIMPKHALEMFNTILLFGYVEKLTDGLYNSIIYKSRRYYLYNTETKEEDDRPFMLALSLDENYKNKSSLQLPDTDLIVFDEFLSKYNYQNEFVDLCDTIKTIIRERDCPFIVLLANTIDKHSFYFKELCIYEAIQEMQVDEQKTVVSPMGTIVDVALIGYNQDSMPEHRKKHNAKFFGFPNPRLNSIRGGAWAVRIFPHPDKEKDTQTVLRNRYISHNGYLLSLELQHNERHGYFVLVHECKDVQDDSIIYTLDVQLKDRRYKYKWGTGKLDKKLYSLLEKNRWFYVNNFCGTLVEDYMRTIKKGDFII